MWKQILLYLVIGSVVLIVASEDAVEPDLVPEPAPAELPAPEEPAAPEESPEPAKPAEPEESTEPEEEEHGPPVDPVEPIDPPRCKPQCGENEVYTDCIIGQCRPLNCSQLGKPIACADIRGPCNDPGCVCVDGYARDDSGKCIPVDNCPSCNGDPNAKSGCGDYCGKSCEDYNKKVVCRNEFCPYNSCECKKGFVYDRVISRCVPPKNCPVDCPANEYFSRCRFAECRAQTCRQVGGPIACPMIIGLCNDAGCVCNHGYARHDNGTCVPIKDCPCNGDENAESGDGNYCGQSCDDYDKNPTCPVNRIRFNGCRCRKGYVYNRDISRCVLPKDCKCSGKNEVYHECLPLCPPEGCDTADRMYKCKPNPKPGDCNCKPGCRCKPGYYRNSKGVCVPKAYCKPKCKKCPMKDEVYHQCAPTCPPESCSTSDAQFKCRAPPQPGDPDCKPGCRCRKGWYRNNKGICVPKSLCEGKCYKSNEEYVICPPNCPGESCSVDIRVIFCAQPPKPGSPECEPNGCRCKNGYCRNKKGECVVRFPEEKCTKKNEVYTECPSTCPGESCGIDTRLIKCRQPLEVGHPDCAPAACICKPGYCRNEKGECVKSEPKFPKKPKCKKPHEKFTLCPPTCPGESCSVNPQLVRCREPLKPGNPDCAPDACFCEPGYCRDKNGNCIVSPWV